MTVTFFGHHDASERILPALRKVLSDLIEHHQATRFYMGNQGHFDFYVKRELDNLSSLYPHIQINIVLAYFPAASASHLPNHPLLPNNIENVPPRFARYRRNEWMLSKADMVVTHVLYPTGGAAVFKRKAERMNKTVINIK